jgi:Ca-activated chloride channel family protein
MQYLSWVATSLICFSAAAQQPQAPAPISMGIVFDTSRSMGSKLDSSRQAVAQFFKSATPQDEFFVVQSANRRLRLSGFSPSTDAIETLLTSAQSEGRSALLDAIYLSVREIRKARNPRKALLVISDGADNGSRYTESEIKRLMGEAEVPIYAIGIYDSFAVRGRTDEELFGPGLLHRIAERTGGRHFAVESSADLPDAVAKLSAALR